MLIDDVQLMYLSPEIQISSPRCFAVYFPTYIVIVNDVSNSNPPNNGKESNLKLDFFRLWGLGGPYETPKWGEEWESHIGKGEPRVPWANI